MVKDDIYNKTSARLSSYRLFSNTTIATISSLAKQQASYSSYKDFFKAVGITNYKIYKKRGLGGVPVLDIPSKTRQTMGVMVMHLPMGNSLDPNQMYQIATIAASNPKYRIVAFGNPSGKPFSFKEQNLTLKKRFDISFTRNKKSLVEIELDYLHSQSIEEVHLLGYSYGAMKALLMASYLPPNTVRSFVLVEPVAHPRNLIQLIHDFVSTFKPMGEYVNRTGIQGYFDARQDAGKLVSYNAGLTRPINIAIGFLLARIDFVRLLEEVLNVHPEARATIAWATRSEIGNDAHLKVSMHRLKYDEKKNVSTIRLEDDSHAVANDIHLHGAIVMEAINSASLGP